MIEIYLDESMFDDEFSNLRRKIVDTVPYEVPVTNITKLAGSKRIQLKICNYKQNTKRKIFCKYSF